MKVRIKFKKYGVLRFIGHLDVMRLFQKLMRRAQIPIAFTGGFSPHMIMSFASPLGIGLTSEGEYVDIELAAPISSREAVSRLNDVAPEGIEVVSFREISPEKKMTGMAIVAAADYLVYGKDDSFFEEWEACLADFAKLGEINVLKQTKRSEAMVDIRPLIYRLETRDKAIYMQLAAGSVKNLKPDLVMDAFFSFAETKHDGDVKIPLAYQRLEMYANIGNEEAPKLVPLDSLGEEILL